MQPTGVHLLMLPRSQKHVAQAIPIRGSLHWKKKNWKKKKGDSDLNDRTKTRIPFLATACPTEIQSGNNHTPLICGTHLACVWRDKARF
jgi:hypothetical protein